MSGGRIRRGIALAFALLFALLLAAALAAVTVARDMRPVRSLTVSVWKIYYETFPVTDRPELEALHLSAGSLTREQCIACHGDQSASKLPLHRIHLQNALLSNIACHECHARVELRAKSSKQGATWVRVAFCKQCHSAFPGLKSGDHKPSDFRGDCTRCHKGDKAAKHARPYLPRKIPTRECQGCHGKRALPWTSRHERTDWLKTHGSEALRAGAQSCFECHDFGLKFCSSCHTKPPASHEPTATWLDEHPSRARTDTRVCYACHATSDCKRCHLNHEDGWLAGHPAYITKHGDVTCAECHSASSCSYCHTHSSAGLR